MIETRAAFARRIGINKSNVTRAAQAGRIVLTADGMVDVEASLRRWQDTKGGRDDVAARHAANRRAAGQGPQPNPKNGTAPRFTASAPPPGDDAASPGNDGHTRTRYKAMGLHYENQLIKLEMDVRRGIRCVLEAV